MGKRRGYASICSLHWHPLFIYLIFLVVTNEKETSLSIIVVTGARCNMSQHKALLTDARALRRARQRAT